MMRNGFNGEPNAGKPVPELEVKRQIFAKLTQRLAKALEISFCSELNPDVIVISRDQTLFFEPQNIRAAKVLHQCCGMNLEEIEALKRVCVHPCESQRIIDGLRAAGLNVDC